MNHLHLKTTVPGGMIIARQTRAHLLLHFTAARCLAVTRKKNGHGYTTKRNRCNADWNRIEAAYLATNPHDRDMRLLRPCYDFLEKIVFFCCFFDRCYDYVEKIVFLS